jgi:hypothetical protein
LIAPAGTCAADPSARRTEERAARIRIEAIPMHRLTLLFRQTRAEA